MIVLEVYDGPEAIARASAEAAFYCNGVFKLALSGGLTYKSLLPYWLEIMNQKPPCLPAFFPVDERMVPFNSPESNWGCIWREFLNLTIRNKDMKNYYSTPAEFEEKLEAFFGNSPHRFDLVFLGIGTDGHTAGLFPGQCPQPGSGDWYAPFLRTTAPEYPENRLTLGPETIASATRLIIIAFGKSKADALRRVLEHDSTLPPVLITDERNSRGMDSRIMIDSELAEALSAHESEGVRIEDHRS